MSAYKAFDLKRYPAGIAVDLGSHVFTEEEIIDFAKLFDPLDFHTDKKSAKESVFKGLITSGPHPFNHFYRNGWITLFGKSVMCGLEVSNWRFTKPIYAGKTVKCKVIINKIRLNQEKHHVTINWLFDIRNDKGEMVQSLDMMVMHFI